MTIDIPFIYAVAEFISSARVWESMYHHCTASLARSLALPLSLIPVLAKYLTRIPNPGEIAHLCERLQIIAKFPSQKYGCR